MHRVRVAGLSAVALSPPIDLGTGFTLMVRVMGSGALTGYDRVEFESVVHDGVGITRVGHPAAPYPSLDIG